MKSHDDDNQEALIEAKASLKGCFRSIRSCADLLEMNSRQKNEFNELYALIDRADNAAALFRLSDSKILPYLERVKTTIKWELENWNFLDDDVKKLSQVSDMLGSTIDSMREDSTDYLESKMFNTLIETMGGDTAIHEADPIIGAINDFSCKALTHKLVTNSKFYDRDEEKNIVADLISTLDQLAKSKELVFEDLNIDLRRLIQESNPHTLVSELNDAITGYKKYIKQDPIIQAAPAQENDPQLISFPHLNMNFTKMDLNSFTTALIKLLKEETQELRTKLVAETSENTLNIVDNRGGITAFYPRERPRMKMSPDLEKQLHDEHASGEESRAVTLSKLVNADVGTYLYYKDHIPEIEKAHKSGSTSLLYSELRGFYDAHQNIAGARHNTSLNLSESSDVQDTVLGVMQKAQLPEMLSNAMDKANADRPPSKPWLPGMK